ncbi:hypothetical protein [Candidatus Magnetobacterium casense]|uniref:Uncharacterized protein n=1 Tax=Candidatus Magnetobacterium casense TaxID=1455061 RepID=A0ABS6RUU0_9BACT|nr:hypothetical protein [Candidatus Magnetobacterium casensis]MBV6340346.1 hypothetical protein [Candidatus Magnetobacterium casensis]
MSMKLRLNPKSNPIEIDGGSLIQQRLDEDQEYIKMLKRLTQDLSNECDILRQLSKQVREEAQALRTSLVGEHILYASIRDIKDKVEQIHNKTCLIEEQDMTR